MLLHGHNHVDNVTNDNSMTTQAIPRYKQFPSGSLFPLTESDEDIEEYHQTRYTVISKDGNHHIKCTDVQGKKATTEIPVPNNYVQLIRRFLWRGQTFLRLYESGREHGMTEESLEMVGLNLQHFINTFGWCRPAFRDAEQQREEVRIPVFDWYMAEEYYVGRHDPACVVMWQMEHSNINLCAIDVMQLGEWLFHSSLKDQDFFISA